MENGSNTYKEIREIAPLVADLIGSNPYTVPVGYFASLSTEIISRVTLPPSVGMVSPYRIPNGYFDHLAGSVMQKIQEQESASRYTETYLELEEVAPLLNSIGKANVYSIPERYFKMLEAPSVSKVQPASGKILSMGSYMSKWINYAAAASVLFIVATSSFLYVNKHFKSLDKNPSIEQRLADIKDDDIINYLRDNQETPGDYVPASYQQEKEMQDMLKSASDEDIQRYLNESNDPGEKTIKGI